MNRTVEVCGSGGSWGFEVGMPRVGGLRSITYWAHHTHSENLIGLYYDFVEARRGMPQVLAVMHAELDCKVDWRRVSVGKAGSKKTSNTCLTSCGRAKLQGGVVTIVNDARYQDALRGCGLKF
jgi:hypothetical protein